MNLYLAAYYDGADNRDLFIWASNPTEARDMWLAEMMNQLGEVDPREVQVFQIPLEQPDGPKVLAWPIDIPRRL